MSTFGGLILTNRGRNLQSKAQAGITLQYTRIGVGDGHLGSTSILDLNNLVNEVMSLDITKLKVLGDGRAVIGTVLSNQNMTEGFYFREIGLFAEDPDLGEVLYCYGNAGELAEYISAGGGTDIIEKSIDIQTIVGNAENISAVINESLVYATKEDLENIEIPVTSVNNKTGDVKLTAEDVGAETPDGAQAKVNALAGEGNTKTVKDLDEEIAAHKAEKATQEQDGHMTKEDKMKLNGIEEGARKLENVDNVKQMPISGGEFTGIVKAYPNTSYTVAQIRNIILSPNNANVSAMNNGDIWIKYK